MYIYIAPYTHTYLILEEIFRSDLNMLIKGCHEVSVFVISKSLFLVSQSTTPKINKHPCSSKDAQLLMYVYKFNIVDSNISNYHKMETDTMQYVVLITY